jgi:hypothetical protein
VRRSRRTFTGHGQFSSRETATTLVAVARPNSDGSTLRRLRPLSIPSVGWVSPSFFVRLSDTMVYPIGKNGAGSIPDVTTRKYGLRGS